MPFNSFSSVSLAQRCGRQYLIERVLGIGEWQEKPSLWFGGLLHRMLESFYTVMKATGECAPDGVIQGIITGLHAIDGNARGWLTFVAGASTDEAVAETLHLVKESVYTVSNNMGEKIGEIVGFDGRDWHRRGGNGKAYWTLEKAVNEEFGSGLARLVSEEYIGCVPAFLRHKGMLVEAGHVREIKGETYSVHHLQALVDLAVDRFKAYIDHYGVRDSQEWEILGVEGGGEVDQYNFSVDVLWSDKRPERLRFSAFMDPNDVASNLPNIIGADCGEISIIDVSATPIKNAKWSWKYDLKVRIKATGAIALIEFKSCGSRNISDTGYYNQKTGYCALEGVSSVITRYTLKKRPSIPTPPDIKTCRAAHKGITSPCTKCGAKPGEKAGRAVSLAESSTTAELYIEAVASLGLDWTLDADYTAMVEKLRSTGNNGDDAWFFLELPAFTPSQREIAEWRASGVAISDHLDKGWAQSWNFRKLVQAGLKEGKHPREMISTAPLSLLSHFPKNPTSCSDFGGCSHVETCWGCKVPKVENAEDSSFDL